MSCFIRGILNRDISPMDNFANLKIINVIDDRVSDCFTVDMFYDLLKSIKPEPELLGTAGGDAFAPHAVAEIDIVKLLELEKAAADIGGELNIQPNKDAKFLILYKITNSGELMLGPVDTFREEFAGIMSKVDNKKIEEIKRQANELPPDDYGSDTWNDNDNGGYEDKYKEWDDED